jgi:hypothetical protein
MTFFSNIAPISADFLATTRDLWEKDDARQDAHVVEFHSYAWRFKAGPMFSVSGCIAAVQKYLLDNLNFVVYKHI